MKKDGSRTEIASETAADSYSDFADAIGRLETERSDEIPLDEPADIATALDEPVAALAAGERTARAVPTLNAYDRLVDREIPEAILHGLTALDVIINATDDIVDTDPLDARTRVRHCSNILLGHVLLVENLGNTTDAATVLAEYYTAVAQIPRVERVHQQRLQSADDRSEAIDAARTVYRYDSVDIEGFGVLAGKVLGVDPETTATLVDDLRTFRARHLLYEDLRHVERTARQGDTNPIMYFLRNVESTARATEHIEAVLSAFEYPDDREYLDVLRAAERPPSDLEATVAEKTQLIRDGGGFD